MIVISVEGLIASGKTTLVENLYRKLTSKGYKIQIVNEPIEEWQKCGIFEKFCAEPKRYAYSFQTFVHATRIQECLKYSYDGVDIVFLERSPFTDKNIFVEMLVSNGTLNGMELEMYRRWWELWMKLMPFEITNVLYVKTPVKECLKRVDERNRSGEKTIVSLEYEQMLYDLHEKVFGQGDVDIYPNKQTKCLIVDGMLDFKTNDGVMELIAEKILELM